MLKALRHHPLLVGTAELIADALRYIAIVLVFTSGIVRFDPRTGALYAVSIPPRSACALAAESDPPPSVASCRPKLPAASSPASSVTMVSS